MTQTKSTRAFRTISEAADELGLQAHVLRFWESKFSEIQPMKRRGGRRFYRPEDIEFLRGIKILLHREKHPIKDVQKLIRIKGAQSIVELGRSREIASQPKNIKDTDLVPDRIKPVIHTQNPQSEPVPAAAQDVSLESQPTHQPKAANPALDTRKEDDDIIRRVVPIDVKSRRRRRSEEMNEQVQPENIPELDPIPEPEPDPAPVSETAEVPPADTVNKTDLKDALSKLRSMKSRWEKFK